MRFGLDTNVLAYAEGVNDKTRQRRALDILEALPPAALLVPVQALGELFRVLTVKMKRPPAKARLAILSWRDAAQTANTTESALLAALDLAADHRLSLWDALILSVTAEAGCRYLLSEDFQEGFSWRGVTVLNPFADPLPAPLAHVMRN